MGLAVLIWLMLGTALAGVGMTIVVTNPDLYDNGRIMIPLLCGGGFILAIPFSYVIANKIKAGTRVHA